MAEDQNQTRGQISVLQLLDGIIAFANKMDMPQFFDYLVDAALLMSKSEQAALFLLDNSLGNLHLHTCRTFGGRKVQTDIVPIQGGLIEQTLAGCKTSRLTGTSVYLAEGLFAKSALCVPLLSQGQGVGVLCVFDTQTEDQFTPGIETQLEVLAGCAALAIDNSNLRDQAKRRSDAFSSLNMASHEVLTSHKIADLLNNIAKNALVVFAADIVILYECVNRSRDVRLSPVVVGSEIRSPEILRERGQALPHEESAVIKVLRSGQPFYAEDAKVDWRRNAIDDRSAAISTKGFVYREDIFSSAGVPLIWEGQTLAILFINYRTRNPFHKDLRSRIESFASDAALAIHIANVFLQRERYIEHLSVLNDIGKQFSSASTLSITQIVAMLHKQVARVMDANNFYIASWNENQKSIHFELVTKEGKAGASADAHCFDRKGRNGLTEFIINTKSPLLIPSNVQEWLRYHNVEEIGRPAKCWMGAPIIVGHNVFGVIGLQNYEQENVYDDDDLAILTLIASQVAIAIDMARLYADAQARAGELEALHDSALHISSKESIDFRLEEIVNAAADLLRVRGGKVYLKLPGEAKLELKAIKGVGANVYPRGSILEIGAGISGRVFQSKEPAFVSDYSQFEGRIEPLKDIFGAVVAVPLMHEDECLGVLAVFDDQNPTTLREKDIIVLQRFARQASLAIHDAQLTDRLKRRIQTLETLHKAAQAIAKQTGNLDQTLDQILEQALLLLGDKLQEGAHSYIALLTSKNVLGFAAARPKAIAKTIKKVKLDLQEDRRIGIAGRTVKTRDPQIVNDVREDPDYLALDERVTSELAVPIRDETDVIGVIGLAHPKHSVFDTQDCQALEILASYAAYYIRSAKSIERLAGINEEEREMVELTFNDTSGSFAGQFYYGEVVHDLRQVLTQIQQTVRLLHDDSGMRKLSSNSQKMLGKLQDRVTESGQAIDQYLEDTQEKEQKFARQDINAIIDHTIRLLRGRLDDASIEVDLSGLERGLPFVYVNRVQILMIMFNLVTNAIDALQEVHRPRKIRIATRICDEDTRYIEIIIQDNGCGIKKENQKRIFEPRFTTKGKKGRGLGLFGTRRLLDKHFGSISVLSQHLKGTTFNVRIPKS